MVGLGISETSTVVHLPKPRSRLGFLTELYNLVGPTSPQVTGSHAIQLGISSFIATSNIQLLHNHRTVKHNIYIYITSPCHHALSSFTNLPNQQPCGFEMRFVPRGLDVSPQDPGFLSVQQFGGSVLPVGN